MNIYHIQWVQSDQFGLSAVVIAASENKAIKALNLSPDYNSKICATCIGISHIESSGANIVCCESL